MNVSAKYGFRTLVGMALALIMAASVHADDSDRIDELERRIQAIEAQLSEVLRSQGPRFKEGEGWKSLSNWRELRRGMRPIEVRELLDDAHRVEGGYFTRWRYPNGGVVGFANEEVNEWTEPQQ
jgi:hypothetical protein